MSVLVPPHRLEIPLAASELLGGQLPTQPIGWIVLLLAIWGGLSCLVAIWRPFAKLMTSGREPLKRLLAGLVLPVGWGLWSFAFLYADCAVDRWLVVVGGCAVLLLLGGALWMRARKAPSTP